MSTRASIIFSLGTASLAIAITIISVGGFTMIPFIVFFVVAIIFMGGGMWLGWSDDKEQKRRYKLLLDTMTSQHNAIVNAINNLADALRNSNSGRR